MSAASATGSATHVLLRHREIVVDDKRHLLDVDAAGEQVGGDEDTGRSGAELLHDDLALALLEVAVDGRDGELARAELVGQPVDPAT